MTDEPCLERIRLLLEYPRPIGHEPSGGMLPAFDRAEQINGLKRL